MLYEILNPLIKQKLPSAFISKDIYAVIVYLIIGNKMELPTEVKDIFENETCHQLATASLTGEPNISNIGGKYLMNDGTIVVIDNFMKKTKKNVLENQKVAILIRREKRSFQIKGTCKYLNEGEEYVIARDWMKVKGDKYPAKGALFIKVESVYNSMTDENAGELIVE